VDDRIQQLLGKLTSLEDELRTALHEREERLYYRLEGRRVEFEEAVRSAHRKARVGVLRWLAQGRPQNYLTAPVIYSLGVPFALLDLSVTIYQAICFPVYRIAKVKRADYIAVDRQQLEYLNAIERFHCTYCAYANGLLAYVAEIAGRTEQYFCPIKHAHKVLGSHSRYARFLAFGDADGYPGKLEAFRKALGEELRR
jgi:hypothetical protein